MEMSEAAAKRLAAHNETVQWHSKCRKCGAQLKGTLAELLAHKCHDPDTKAGAAA